MKMSQKELARVIGISYGRLNRAINGRQLFKADEGDKIDSFFKYERGFVVSVQISNKSVDSSDKMPVAGNVDKPVIRTCVFWDTALNKLDWIKHRKFITERVSIYGNEDEKQALQEYYRDVREWKE